jgi:hypothetical protein
MVGLMKTCNVKVIKQIIREELQKVIAEARKLNGYYLMDALEDLAGETKRAGEPKAAKALMYLHSRINQSYRDKDLSVDDVLDLFNDPRGRKYGREVPDWMIEDLFEGKKRAPVKKFESVSEDYRISAKHTFKVTPDGGIILYGRRGKIIMNREEIKNFLQGLKKKHIPESTNEEVDKYGNVHAKTKKELKAAIAKAMKIILSGKVPDFQIINGMSGEMIGWSEKKNEYIWQPTAIPYAERELK